VGPAVLTADRACGFGLWEDAMQHRIRDVLSLKGERLLTAEPAETVLSAVRRMNAAAIGCLPVVERDRLVGIFTERDALVRVVEAERAPADTLVREVMTEGPLCVSPGTTVEDTMIFMTENHCRHLPVVEADELAGLISIGDLIRWLVRDKDVRIERLLGAMRVMAD